MPATAEPGLVFLCTLPSDKIAELRMHHAMRMRGCLRNAFEGSGQLEGASCCLRHRHFSTMLCAARAAPGNHARRA